MHLVLIFFFSLLFSFSHFFFFHIIFRYFIKSQFYKLFKVHDSTRVFYQILRSLSTMPTLVAIETSDHIRLFDRVINASAHSSSSTATPLYGFNENDVAVLTKISDDLISNKRSANDICEYYAKKHSLAEIKQEPKNNTSKRSHGSIGKESNSCSQQQLKKVKSKSQQSSSIQMVSDDELHVPVTPESSTSFYEGKDFYDIPYSGLLVKEGDDCNAPIFLISKPNIVAGVRTLADPVRLFYFLFCLSLSLSLLYFFLHFIFFVSTVFFLLTIDTILVLYSLLSCVLCSLISLSEHSVSHVRDLRGVCNRRGSWNCPFSTAL